jgi:hypothetical protein
MLGVAGGAWALNTRKAEARRKIDHARFRDIPRFNLETQFE